MCVCVCVYVCVNLFYAADEVLKCELL
jgi:hypothetical protein